MRLDTYLKEASYDIHPFEKAGLGKHPYIFIGTEQKTYQACHGAPIQPGGSCDYCGTGIIYMFWLKSADGKKFKVGSECIMKADRTVGSTAGTLSPEDRKLKKAVTDFKAKMLKDRQKERSGNALQFFDADEGFREMLNAMDAPYGGRGTAYEWVVWMRAHSGMAGTMKITKYLEKLIKNGWTSLPRKKIVNPDKPVEKPKQEYHGIPGPYDKEMYSLSDFDRRAKNAYEAIMSEPKFKKALENEPHPKGFRNKTYLDYAIWMYSQGYQSKNLIEDLEAIYQETFKVKL